MAKFRIEQLGGGFPHLSPTLWGCGLCWVHPRTSPRVGNPKKKGPIPSPERCIDNGMLLGLEVARRPVSVARGVSLGGRGRPSSKRKQLAWQGSIEGGICIPSFKEKSENNIPPFSILLFNAPAIGLSLALLITVEMKRIFLLN